jgi:hypothetical protein
MTKSYVVDGKYRFTIDFRSQSDGTYKLFALEYPENPHSGSVQSHHLYSSGEICITTGHEPRTLDRARALAMLWCEGWSYYVQHGTFPTGRRKVSV